MPPNTLSSPPEPIPKALEENQVVSANPGMDPSIVDRMKNNPIFAMAFLNSRTAEGSEAAQRQKQDMADSIFLEGYIQELLLNDGVRLIAPVEISNEICAVDSHITLQGQLPPRDIMDMIRNKLPEHHEQILRDLAKIAQEKASQWPYPLPQVSGKELEDPFRIGKKYLASIFDKRSSDAKSLIKEIGPVMSTESVNVSDLAKGLAKKLSPRAQRLILIALEEIVRKNPEQENAFDIWNRVSRTMPDTHIGGKVNFFIRLRGSMSEGEQKGIIMRLIREFFESDDDSNIHPLLALHQTPAGKHFSHAIGKQTKLLAAFVELTRNGSVLENAFALQVLGEYVNAEDAEERTKQVTREMFQSTSSLRNEVSGATLTRFIERYAEKSELYMSAMEAILENDDLFRAVHIGKIRNSDLEEIMEELRMEFPALSQLPTGILNEAIKRKLMPQKASSEFYLELDQAEMPEDFDTTQAINDIFNKTSLPLLEARGMDLNGILSPSFHVTIAPLPQSETLGSWRLIIRFTNFRGRKLVNEEVTLDFEECRLASETPEQHSDLLGQIGLYCAHKFFVKQEGVAEMNGEEPTQDSADLPDVDVDMEVEELPYNERRQTPLNIDISSQTRDRIRDRGSRIRQSMHDNKAVVNRLLNGVHEDSDISEAIIHRVMGGSSAKPIYERVPEDEILRAVLYETLERENWYVLNTLPHIKSLGYHLRELRVGPDEDEPNPPVTGYPLWVTRRKYRTENAELALLAYNESGFPELSDFSQVEAWIGVTADAQHERGHISEIKTEDGEVLFEGTCANTDLNAAIAKRTTNKTWMRGWLETQRRILNDDIEAVLESDLEEEEKLEIAEGLEEQLTALPEKIGDMMKQTGIRHMRTPDGQEFQTVRLALDRVLTETSFNQGQFLPILRLRNMPDLDQEDENQRDEEE